MSHDPFRNEEASPVARWGNRLLLGLFGVVAAAMLVLITLSFVMPPMLQGMVDDFTEAEPIAFEAVEVSEAEREDFERRYDAFEAAVALSEAREPLEISEREMNGLLAQSDDAAERVRVEFRDGLLHAQMSIPVDSDLEIGPWRGHMRGLYLNGVAALKPSLESDGLSVTLTDFVVKGESVPGWIHSLLQHEIDRLDWLHSEDVADAVSKLESIRIEGDRLVLRPKR